MPTAPQPVEPDEPLMLDAFSRCALHPEYFAGVCRRCVLFAANLQDLAITQSTRDQLELN